MVTMRTVGGEGLPPDFAGALRAARVAAGVSLEVLAGRVGCAKSYLSAMENGVKGPPSAEVVERLEAGLGLGRGVLRARADWGRTPGEVKRDFGAMRAREREARALASMLREGARGGSLDQMFKSGALRGLIERVAPERAEGAVRGACVEALAALLPVEIPVINKVTAGYPAGFTDLDYPARVADEYIRAPDVHDPDAFAARVVGDSMTPDYREGDIVVFSPALEVKSGMDCFVRLEPDHESTFKRVYFEAGEGGEELIRIQPINEAYPARVVERERVAGLYAGVSVVRAIQSGK